MTTTTTGLAPLPPQPPQAFAPVRGISYQAKPFKVLTTEPGPDMAQEGFQPQWHTMRDDLGMIRKMGGSAVRIYAGIGSDIYSDHSKFLDRCQSLGLNVIVDFFTPGLCDDFDCSAQWKKAALNALKVQGYMKDGSWHPAVKLIMLINEPDNLPFTTSTTGLPPECENDVSGKPKAQCRVKAVLSAFDGLLQAEKEAGMAVQTVFVGVAWSWSARTSIDAVETAELYGFQDMKAAITNPFSAGYVFLTGDAATQWSARWVNAINSPAQWSFIKEKVNDRYAPYQDQKFLISQMNPDDNSAQDLTADLKHIDDAAKTGGPFLGVVYNGFQSDYTDIAAFTRLFSLGDTKLTDMNICREDPRTPEFKDCVQYPLYCLTLGDKGDHVTKVSKAWGGDPSNAVGLCKGQLVEGEVTEDEFVF